MVLFAPSLPTSKVTQQQAQANNVWLESGSYGIDLVMRAAWQVNAQSMLVEKENTIHFPSGLSLSILLFSSHLTVFEVFTHCVRCLHALREMSSSTP
jgi:hypothetical protein